MSNIATLISGIESARDTIRSKMVAANQATSTDKLATLASNLEIGIDTSDANATADDILAPKTAYVNGVKVTGTRSIATAAQIRAAIDAVRT